MVGTRALSKLWAAAERSGAKLVLVGDNRQVPEIEAGGAFGALAKALEAPELTENRRQGEAWERAALAELRSGTPAKAVEAYASHGRVVLAETAVEARRAMVGQWWAARARRCRRRHVRRHPLRRRRRSTAWPVGSPGTPVISGRASW